jgi:hypothetical protein
MLFYEWDVEWYSVPAEASEGEFAELEDHDHRDTLSEYDDYYLKEVLQGDVSKKLALIRHYGSDRSTAYVIDGKLDPYFTNSLGQNVASVPSRFVAELARETKRLDKEVA